MPNIIEQQDLLKGLPDNRLAMMMQSPTGDIPPFLVAAEAQRRQAIRQQFSGGPQESVVDTLTKQLAGSVPQNIQSGPQQPPQMPPPMMQPQMAGVAALQQQMPQQAPQQAMRSGGYVQRYQEGSLVTPSFRGRAGAGGYSPGEVPERNIIDRVIDYVGTSTEPFRQNIQRFGLNPTVEQLAQIRTETEAAEEKADPFSYGMTREERQTMQRAPVPEPPPVEPGKEPTSTENQSKVSLEEYRKQLEAIYGVNAGDSEYIKGKIEELYGSGEPSSWEKSQKWFSAAQAAIQPGQNNWQAAINAAAAFGGGMADERASERENQQALAEAMLRYEMGDMQQRRQSEQEIAKQMLQMQMGQQEAEAAAAAARRKEQLGAYEFYAGGAKETIDAANQSIRSLVMERKEYIDSLPKDMATGQPVTADGKPVSAENDPVLRSIEEQIRSYRDMIAGASAQRQKALGGYGAMTGTDPSVLTYSPGRLTPYGG